VLECRSPLRFERFFETLYLRYDERYVFSAPDLKTLTRRREWSPNSPIFYEKLVAKLGVGKLDYQPRVATSEPADEDG
jgi:hypothetical protein